MMLMREKTLRKCLDEMVTVSAELRGVCERVEWCLYVFNEFKLLPVPYGACDDQKVYFIVLKP